MDRTRNSLSKAQHGIHYTMPYRLLIEPQNQSKLSYFIQ
jgi:hypothetical protein